MEDLVDLINEKYEETFITTQPPWVIKESKRAMEFRPADAAQLYMILNDFDAIAGTTRKDMASHRDQLVARRLSDKIKNLCVKDGTEMQPYIDAREKFKSAPVQEEAKKDKNADYLKELQSKQIKPDNKEGVALLALERRH